MKFRLCTLLILATIVPPVLAGVILCAGIVFAPVKRAQPPQVIILPPPYAPNPVPASPAQP